MKRKITTGRSGLPFHLGNHFQASFQCSAVSFEDIRPLMLLVQIVKRFQIFLVLLAARDDAQARNHGSQGNRRHPFPPQFISKTPASAAENPLTVERLNLRATAG